MAKVQKSRKGSRKKKQEAAGPELPQRLNYIILLTGIGVAFLGLLLMSLGGTVSPLSITVAPVILFLGYCVIIPAGLIYRKKKQTAESAE